MNSTKLYLIFKTFKLLKDNTSKKIIMTLSYYYDNVELIKIKLLKLTSKISQFNIKITKLQLYSTSIPLIIITILKIITIR